MSKNFKIITEFELKNILNKTAARLAKSIKAGAEEYAKGATKWLDEVAAEFKAADNKKGPKQ